MFPRDQPVLERHRSPGFPVGLLVLWDLGHLEHLGLQRDPVARPDRPRLQDQPVRRGQL